MRQNTEKWSSYPKLRALISDSWGVGRHSNEKHALEVFSLDVERLPVCLHQLLQLLYVSSLQFCNLLTLLDEDESWHGSDLVLCGHLLNVVNIHLDEDHVFQRLVQFLKNRCDHLARPAPGCKKVNNHQFLPSRSQLVLEVISISHSVDHLGCSEHSSLVEVNQAIKA